MDIDGDSSWKHGKFGFSEFCYSGKGTILTIKLNLQRYCMPWDIPCLQIDLISMTLTEKYDDSMMNQF